MIKSIELLKLLEKIQYDERDNHFTPATIDNCEFIRIEQAIFQSDLHHLYKNKEWFSISKQPPELQTWIMNYLWERCEEISEEKKEALDQLKDEKYQ